MFNASRSRQQPGQTVRVWLPAACAVLVVATAFWTVSRRSDVNFLVDDWPAHWIIYPSVPSLGDQPDGPRRAIFSRRFRLEQPAVDARIRVRALKEYVLALNGVELAKSASGQGQWKTPLDTIAAKDAFVPGENELVATVTCHRGPPALWLALDTGSEQIVSDGEWQASLLDAEPLPARLATSIPQFGPGSAAAEGERPMQSLTHRWPTLLVCAAIAAIAAGVWHWRTGRPSAAQDATARTIWLVGSALAVAWLVLLVSNCQFVPFVLGYDAELHLDYVEHIQQHGSLPRGDEGLEMWQPPLFYMIASLITSFAQAPAKSETAILLLRAFSCIASLAQLVLVAGCLRRLYPGRSWSPSVGLFFAGCVPVQLYLMHYASNDVLAALFSTASLYAALVLIEQPRTRIRTAVILGVCLGAATITKLTTWPIVVAVFATLLFQLLVERRTPGQWLSRLVAPALAWALVCGWYFVRNYQNFGQPLPPDQAGYAYGQDPGYSTPGQFLRFGQSLREPFFSAFAGVPDGIYSTLWGDGAWGGQVARDGRPPWNYDLMAAGYLVALVPSLLILIGVGAVAWQVVRGWQPERLLLFAASAASFCGISYFYLRHPMYGAVKAHYAFASIASLSMFLVEGCLVLTGDSRWRRLVLTAALGTWGLASLGTYFVVGSSAETQHWVARQLALQGNVQQALMRIGQAIHKHPGDVGLHLLAGRLLHRAGRNQEANAELNLAMRIEPDNAGLQLASAQVLNSLGQQQAERRRLQRVVRLAPDDPRGHVGLAHNLAAAGEFEAAIDAARAGLRVSPIDPRLHVILAESSVQVGRMEKAIEHYRIVLDFNPSDLPALSGLASIFAMHPDPRHRDARQAVEMARKASEVTEHNNPAVEDILAAAYAEAGNFADAEKTLHAAIEHARQEGPEETLERLKAHLASVESREPLREPALAGGPAKETGD